MMRCLGAPQRQMLALFALQFLMLGLAASVVGCVVALGGQQLLVDAARGDGQQRSAAARTAARGASPWQPDC